MKSTTMTRLMLVMAVGSFVLPSALAGDLEPPGPPAPTMVTLQEIHDLIQSQGGSGAAVAKTGQTSCWNQSGALVDCTGTGQDGEYQAGVSVSPRFTDNGDGTVKDNLTGLIWLKNANCFGFRNWTDALTDANTLSDGTCGLADGSADGAWRLPNIKELQSLIDFGIVNPALPTGHPFSGADSISYWSSTTQVDAPIFAWLVDFYNGFTFGFEKDDDVAYVWPVRSGQ
jgi:hypothetical protein